MRASGGPFMRKLLILPLMLLLCSICWPQAKLSVHWEELTAADFRNGIEKSQGTCLLPFGILEKHGPHLPLGTDLLNVRYVSLQAAQQEYAVVFPEYYFGQIFEAQHEPGTVAYSSRATAARRSSLLTAMVATSTCFLSSHRVNCRSRMTTWSMF